MQSSGPESPESPSAPAPVLADNPAESRYEMHVGGALAGFVTYHRAGHQINLMHTEVEPAFQGEHNFEVFGELGIREAELKRLADAGVLVTHPRARDAQAAVKPPPQPGQAA